MKFLEAITNVFRVPDLRKRLLFALALLAVYRLGGHIPTPGIDTNKLEEFFRQNQGTLFGYLDVFSGAGAHQFFASGKAHSRFRRRLSGVEAFASCSCRQQSIGGCGGQRDE